MSNNKKNNRLIIIIIMLLIVCIGGTFAWFTYRTRETALVLSIGDINDSKLIIKPYQIRETLTPVNTYTSGVYSQVTAINNSSNDMIVNLFYRINQLDETIINNGLKYTIASSDSVDGTYTEVTTGDFKAMSKNNEFVILNVDITSDTTKYYRVYLWLDSSVGDQSAIQNLSIDLELNGMLEQYANAPVLGEGMIPVVISDDGTVTTISEDNDNWYNYRKKEWANIVLVDNDSRSTYLDTENVEVLQDDILAYYVWIPRYKYKIWTTTVSSTGNEQSIGILFESQDEPMSLGTTVGEFRTHPAFWWDANSDGVVADYEMLSGIWVGKFETTGDATTPTVLPNNTSLVNQDISTQAITALKFAGGTLTDGVVSFAGSDTYGLTTETDSHMMKNIEWGAVAYLSHSQYGINDEVRINNYYNEGTLTGCGALTDGESELTTCGIIYGQASEYPQSTTGNITGVYDMSGGTWEYVAAGLYSNIGVITKYYDSYLDAQFTGDNITNMTLCTLETCGGHALSETNGWYNNYSSFVNSSASFFVRGGGYSDSTVAGIFHSYNVGGEAINICTFRSVLIPVETSKVTYEANLFSTTNQTKSDVTVSYDSSTSYLTLDGTASTSLVNMSLNNNMTFIEGEQYKVRLEYVSGNLVINDSYAFVTEIKNGSEQLTTRNYLDLLLPTNGIYESILTVNNASQTEGSSLVNWIWANSSGAVVFDDYVVKVVVTKVEEKNIQYGDYYQLSNNTTRDGYQFMGWNTSEDGSGTTVTSDTLMLVENDHTIYAQWEEIPMYTISYDANGGSGAPASQTKEHGVTLTLSSTVPSRSGFTFLGWGLTSEDTSATYQAGGEYTSNGDIILYAVWEYMDPSLMITSYTCGDTTVGDNPYFTYTGDCKVVDDGDGNWRIKFLSDGTFISNVDVNIDAFLVGGGGGGGVADSVNGGGGGGGGYTNTTYVNLKFGENYLIDIGAGGASKSAGKSTYGFGAVAQGGNAGNGVAGGTGGAGGGGDGGAGGSNGGNGGNGNGGNGGSGQGTTTREFGESTGTLYSGGGGGGGRNAWYNPASGGSGGGASGGNVANGNSALANTGGGGGGAAANKSAGGNGGSGIVVIRNNSSTTTITPFEYDGGYYTVIDDGDGNWRVKFLTSGTFISNIDMTIDVFLVGGGGGGANGSGTYGGGGGAGGYTETSFAIVNSGVSYPIVIGEGGKSGKNGGETSGFKSRAAGGGAGNGETGGSGGSGGGSKAGKGGTNGGNGTKNIGTAGTGQGKTTYEFGNSSLKLYSGGGGGGGYGGYYSSAAGGTGGGAQGGQDTIGTSAPVNTGGGGGGGGNNGLGGDGGSGIIVIKNSDTNGLPFEFEYTGSYKIEFDDDTGNNWRIKFLTSGTFSSNSNLSIDVFLVGGGGGGSTLSGARYGGGGGGGGYTTTSIATINTNEEYVIEIGEGGIAGNSGQSTTAFGISAVGGSPGIGDNGGNGGSGGGSKGAKGGSNGENGSTNIGNAGTGQGITTREFGENTGELYAGGGGGGGYGGYYSSAAGGAGGGGQGGHDSSGSSAISNTGGGGGGNGSGGEGGSGGSGIVVIRNAR